MCSAAQAMAAAERWQAGMAAGMLFSPVGVHALEVVLPRPYIALQDC